MSYNFNSQQKLHPADFMITTIAHLLEDNERVFHGVSSQLPMVSMKVAKALYTPNLTLLNIPGGVNSNETKLSDYSSAGSELWKSSECIFPLEDIFDLSMRGGLDVAFLSGVQFDEHGHVNASVIGDYHKPKVRLPGGAGSAVLIPTVKKAIIWRTKHDLKTFVPKVDFVTTKGNIYKIVTPLAVFAYRNGRLVVEGKHPEISFEELRAQTGFYIDESYCVDLPLPTQQEMSYIRRIDPKGVRYKEF